MNVCAWDNTNINEQYGIVNKFIIELSHISSKQRRLFHARAMITKQKCSKKRKWRMNIMDDDDDRV